MSYHPIMNTSEKVRQLAESYAGLSVEERSEFVSLVSPDELVKRIKSNPVRAIDTKDGKFSQAMDRVFDHHRPLLGKLAR